MLELKPMSRVGGHVDASNVDDSNARRMRSDLLRESACGDGSELVGLNAYVSYDAERACIEAVHSLALQLTPPGRVEGSYEAGAIEFVSCLPGRI